MGPGYFILAVMGCGDGAVMCQEIELRETRYRTEVACLADSEIALNDALEAPYPWLMTDCRRVAPQMAEADSDTLG